MADMVKWISLNLIVRMNDDGTQTREMGDVSVCVCGEAADTPARQAKRCVPVTGIAFDAAQAAGALLDQAVAAAKAQNGIV